MGAPHPGCWALGHGSWGSMNDCAPTPKTQIPEPALLDRFEVVEHQLMGEVPKRGVDVRVLLGRPVRPVRQVARHAVDALVELNVWKLRNPDLHRLVEQV